MLLPQRIAQGVRDGTIVCAFRRWEQPRVKVGGTQLTAAGVVRFDAVEEIAEVAHLTDADARAAGFADLGALLTVLQGGGRGGQRSGRGGDRVFRVSLSWAGEDPRVTLRDQRPDDLARLTAAVQRLDAGKRTGPWTRRILEWIRDHPGTVSTVLAEELDRELLPMKADIRKLKALGLTESLRVGYQLSPRGETYLDSLG
jgi:hypothetical protein